jgi:hypothetical protein
MNNLEPTLTPIGPSNSVVDTPFSSPSNEDFMPSFIVQLNCHNSRATTYSILNTEPVSVISLLIQEPWINPLTCLPPDHEAWWTFYSPEHQPTDLKNKHRVVTYVRKSVASRDIKVLEGNCKFFLALELLLLTGTRLRVLNAYNPPGTIAGLDRIRHWLGAANDRRVASIIGMDSNLHHRSWNPPGYSHIHKEAKSLVALCGRHGF